MLTHLLTAILPFTTPALAEPLEPCLFTKSPQELTIYLLTMEPGDEVFNAFGHSGVYVRDPEKDLDMVYNFGAFASDDPDVLTKFLKGTLPFWLGTRSRRSMEDLYAGEGRTVIASRLALAPKQLRMLAVNLQFAARPENRSYQYQWYTTNCSTRVRDLVDKVIDGEVSAQHQTLRGATARSELLRHAANDPVFWFAQSWALASDADIGLTEWEEMFLPANLRTHLLATEIDGPTGERHSLVDMECLVRQGEHPPPMPTAPRWSVHLWLAGTAMGGTLLVAGARATRWLLGGLLVAQGLLYGTVGSTSAALWVFDGLQVYQRNENLFLANPASFLLLLGGFAVALGWRWGPRFALVSSALLTTVAQAGILFGAVRGFPQHNLGMIGFFYLPLLAATLASAWFMLRRTG